jgi:hypothetical protein
MEMNGYFKTRRTASDRTATDRTSTGKKAMGKTMRGKKTTGKFTGQPRRNNMFFFSFVELPLPPLRLQHLRLSHTGQPTSFLFVSPALHQRIQQKD